MIEIADLTHQTDGELLQWGTVTQWRDHSEETHRWSYNPSHDRIEIKEVC